METFTELLQEHNNSALNKYQKIELDSSLGSFEQRFNDFISSDFKTEVYVYPEQNLLAFFAVSENGVEHYSLFDGLNVKWDKSQSGKEKVYDQIKNVGTKIKKEKIAELTK